MNRAYTRPVSSTRPGFNTRPVSSTRSNHPNHPTGPTGLTDRSDPGTRSSRFGEFLRDNDLIDEEQLLCALADHWSNGGRIGAAISRHGFLSQDQVERWAELYHGVRVIDLGSPDAESESASKPTAWRAEPS